MCLVYLKNIYARAKFYQSLRFFTCFCDEVIAVFFKTLKIMFFLALASINDCETKLDNFTFWFICICIFSVLWKYFCGFG